MPLAEETVGRRSGSPISLLTRGIYLTGVFFSTIVGGAFAFGVGLNMGTDAFWDRWNKGVSVHEYWFRPSAYSSFYWIEAMEGY
jgi:hypothetical protein